MRKRKKGANAKTLALQKQTRDDVAKVMGNDIATAGVSQAHVAAHADTSESGLSRILHGTANPSINLLAQIFESVGKRMRIVTEDIDGERKK